MSDFDEVIQAANRHAEEHPNPIPVRQLSAEGLPRPITSISRTCGVCGACFLRLAPGNTGERGLWSDCGKWFCSQECFDIQDDPAKRGEMASRVALKRTLTAKPHWSATETTGESE